LLFSFLALVVPVVPVIGCCNDYICRAEDCKGKSVFCTRRQDV